MRKLVRGEWQAILQRKHICAGGKHVSVAVQKLYCTIQCLLGVKGLSPCGGVLRGSLHKTLPVQLLRLAQLFLLCLLFFVYI